MPLPIALLPLAKLLPFIKIAALGLVKLVFLLLGSIIAPRFTFRLLNNMTIPTVIKIVRHLNAHDKISAEQADSGIDFLQGVLLSAKREDLSRTEARAILIQMQKDILIGIKTALMQPWLWLKNKLTSS